MANRKGPYSGNARFIEIGSPGIPFRFLVNIDHIDAVRFEEMDPLNTDGSKAQFGWSVNVVLNGQGNQLGFPTMEMAINCYNNTLAMIRAAGVPGTWGPELEPPEPPSPILGPDGNKVAEAVDAALAHPDLAGGDGVGIADNDDDLDLALTEDDIELLDELTKPDPAEPQPH